MKDDKNKAEDRIKAASTVLEEIESAPDQGIPEEVLGSAQCVAVVPTMLKGGFIVGARFGRGVASCRTPKGWSAPAFFTIKGGSFGLQIGGQAVDLVMLIMNDDGMKNLLSQRVQTGSRCQRGRRAGGPSCRRRHRLEIEGAGAELFPGSRIVRRPGTERRRDQPGQGRDPRVLRPHGALQDLADRQNSSSRQCLSVPEHAGQVGQDGRQEELPPNPPKPADTTKPQN